MITHLSVRDQIDLISKKEIKVEELFQEYLSNIEKLNPKLNAIVSLRDKDWIIDKAKAQDEQKVDVTRKQILFKRSTLKTSRVFLRDFFKTEEKEILLTKNGI